MKATHFLVTYLVENYRGRLPHKNIASKGVQREGESKLIEFFNFSSIF